MIGREGGLTGVCSRVECVCRVWSGAFYGPRNSTSLIPTLFLALLQPCSQLSLQPRAHLDAGADVL